MKQALVIDDNRDAADSVCQMLRLLEVDARPAYGPRDAMMMLRDVAPDIVFLDINMPGVDGFEVMAYLRRFPHLQNVPVVFATSDDQPETLNKARKTGALLVIIKPVTVDSLESVLQKVGIMERTAK
jgi:CheY-like chemotaxis protein